jgi:hypothetical protein
MARHPGRFPVLCMKHFVTVIMAMPGFSEHTWITTVEPLRLHVCEQEPGVFHSFAIYSCGRDRVCFLLDIEPETATTVAMLSHNIQVTVCTW